MMNRGPKRSKTPTVQRGKGNNNLNKSYNASNQITTDLNSSTYDGRLNTTYAVDQSLPLHVNDLADALSTSMNAGKNSKLRKNPSGTNLKENSNNALKEISLNQGNINEAEIVSRSLADLRRVIQGDGKQGQNINTLTSEPDFSSSKKTVQFNDQMAGSVKFSNYIEVVGQLREIIHKLQLKDAIQRQEITKLKRANERIKKDAEELEDKVQKLELARQMDAQYLIKLDNQILNEKRTIPKRKKSTSFEHNSSLQNDQKLQELHNTIHELTDKINAITNEKEKLEDVIKNLLFEKEVQKMLGTGTSATTHQNFSPLKGNYSPTSPKFKQSSIMNAVKDYNQIQLKKEHQSTFTSTDSKLHTPERSKSVVLEETPLPNYGDYTASLKHGGSSLNKPIDSHVSSQHRDTFAEKQEHSQQIKSQQSPIRNPAPAQASLNLSSLQNFNSKTITIVHPNSTSSAQNTLKNNVNTPQNHFLSRLNEAQGSANSKFNVTTSDLPTSILGNTMSSQISVVSPNTATSGFQFNKPENRENPILIQQNIPQNDKQGGHRPTMSFNREYEVNQFSNVSPAVLEIINNYRISKNNSPTKPKNEGASQSNSQQVITNPSVFSIGADIGTKSTENFKDADIQLNSEDVRIADPQYTHINFDRIERRKSGISLEEINMTPTNYNLNFNMNNQAPDRIRGPSLGGRNNQSISTSSQFNYSISDNSQLNMSRSQERSVTPEKNSKITDTLKMRLQKKL